MTLRNDLTNTYDQDIIRKTQQTKTDKLNSYIDLDKYRWKDEKIETCQCGNCGQTYPWSNCFEVKEAD